MPGEVRDARDNSAAPLRHNFFRLIRKNIARESQMPAILFGEACADLEAFQSRKR